VIAYKLRRTDYIELEKGKRIKYHLTDFTGFYRILPDFTGFYRILPDFKEFFGLTYGNSSAFAHQ